MATPSSSSAPDPVTAPPSTSSILPKPSLTSTTTTTPTPPIPPLFTAQPLLGKPISSPPQGILYPTGPSHRAFPLKSTVRSPSTDQMVTVANPAGYIRNSSPTAVVAFPGQVRPFVFATDHTPPVHAMRPPQARQVGVAVASAPPKNVPVAAHPKVASFPTITATPEYNNCKERDKSRDDNVVTIHDRKVRLSDGASGSLYALCRSWVRNGLPQESQPSVGDGAMLLPRPLPASMVDIESIKKSEGNNEDEDPDKEEFQMPHFWWIKVSMSVHPVEDLSSSDLLKGHIKHAKKVRARFKKERLLRIKRYKHRLSLLLPLPVEQDRDDAAPRS